MCSSDLNVFLCLFTHGLCFFARTTNNVVGFLKVAVKHAHTDLHEYLCNFSRVSFIWKPILIFWVTLFISIIYLNYYIKIIIYLLVLVSLLQWLFILVNNMYATNSQPYMYIIQWHRSLFLFMLLLLLFESFHFFQSKFFDGIWAIKTIMVWNK